MSSACSNQSFRSPAGVLIRFYDKYRAIYAERRPDVATANGSSFRLLLAYLDSVLFIACYKTF